MFRQLIAAPPPKWRKASLVVQSFLKVPFLTALAPTQSEPPFLIAQTVVLVLFIVAGIVAARRFHPAAA